MPTRAALVDEYLENSDGDYRSPARWSVLGPLLNNGVAKTAYIIPIAGYLILYSDYFTSLFNYPALGHSHGLFTALQRSNMAYYGSALLLLAYAIYFCCRPRLLRGHGGVDFVMQTIVSHDFSTLYYVSRKLLPFLEQCDLPELTQNRNNRLDKVRRSMSNWQQSRTFTAGEFEYVAPDVLRLYFNWQNFTWPPVRVGILVITLAGYALLFLPAVDLFIRVVETSAHWQSMR